MMILLQLKMPEANTSQMSPEASHPSQVHMRCWTINVLGQLTEIPVSAVLRGSEMHLKEWQEE